MPFLWCISFPLCWRTGDFFVYIVHASRPISPGHRHSGTHIAQDGGAGQRFQGG